MTYPLARRALGAALLFLAAAVLAGVTLYVDGVGYRLLGVPAGVLAIFLAWVLRARGAWAGAGWPAALALAYGTAATAQLLAMLLPPPGVLEWVATTALALFALSLASVPSRERLVALLGAAAAVLAVLRFSVVPVLWARLGGGSSAPFGLGAVAEGFRRAIVDERPLRPGAQLVALLALACWVLATRLLWAGPESGDALGTLPLTRTTPR